MSLECPLCRYCICHVIIADVDSITRARFVSAEALELHLVDICLKDDSALAAVVSDPAPNHHEHNANDTTLYDAADAMTMSMLTTKQPQRRSSPLAVGSWIDSARNTMRVSNYTDSTSSHPGLYQSRTQASGIANQPAAANAGYDLLVGKVEETQASLQTLEEEVKRLVSHQQSASLVKPPMPAPASAEHVGHVEDKSSTIRGRSPSPVSDLAALRRENESLRVRSDCCWLCSDGCTGATIKLQSCI